METKSETDKLKKALAENAAFRWTIDRGINSKDAAQLLANDIQETTVLKGGCLESYGGRSLDETLTGAFYSSDILKHHFSEQVRQFQSGSQQPLHTPDQANDQQTEKIALLLEKPYRKWTLEEKVKFRKAHGDEALNRVISETVKAEREAKENK